MSETTALTKPTKDNSLRGQLSGDYFKQQIALALPKHMTADRFVRVALTALLKTPKLADCTSESVIECMLNCSALGLEPDGRRAHLIPYGNKCTLIVDYKGIVELAKRSGDVSNVYAQIVCDSDSFSWENGEVKHQIDFRRERGEMYAVYAQITFKDGTRQVDVMTKSEVDAIRRRSKSGNSGPWVTDYNEMAKKTVFRRVSKWVTLSPEVHDALEKEDDFTDIRTTVSAPMPSPSFTKLDLPKRVKKPEPAPEPTPMAPVEDDFACPPIIVNPAVPPEPERVKPPTSTSPAITPVEELSFEEVVDGAESPEAASLRAAAKELVALREAMKAKDVTEAQVWEFSNKKGLLRPGIEFTKTLTDIRPDKFKPLTTNINAAGATLKAIKGEGAA